MRTLISASDRRICHWAAAALLVTIWQGTSWAADGTWTNGSGDYNTASNWQGNTIASGAGFNANFNTLDIAGDLSVTLDQPLTLGSLTFGDTNLASAGTWALVTNQLATAVLTLDNGGSKPVITANQLTPTAVDDSFIGNNVAGTMGFNKEGVGILTFGQGTASTITGGINVNAGTLRLLSPLPEQAIALANGTTLETSGVTRQMTVAAGGTATVRTSFAATTDLGGILGSAGSTLNLDIAGTGQVDAQNSWAGHTNVNIAGVEAAQANMRLEINAGPFFLNTSFANSNVNLDNVNVFVRTNSYGNTIQMGQLTGPATAQLSGGNAGSAARYQIGALNTSTEFAGTINGAGGITIDKTGTGTLTLSGAFMGDGTNNSLAIGDLDPGRQGGMVRARQGTLKLTGASSIPGGFSTFLTTIDVLTGATFDVSETPATFTTSTLQKIQGGGTVLGNYNHADGFIYPGDVSAPNNDAREDDYSAAVTPTAGTLTFMGDLQLSGGGIVYDMSLNPNSGNDLIHVTGSTSVSGGAITPNFFSGIPSSGTYTVLTSDGGITGNVGSMTVDLPGRGTDPIPFLSGDGMSIQFTAQAGGGSANLIWTGANGGIWDIETTQAWSNNGSPDVFFDLDTVSFTETATNKSVNVNAIVSPAGTVTINNTSAYTFTGTGAIVGTVGLTKTGGGDLSMQVANTYTGPTSLTGGGTVDIAATGTPFGTGAMTMDGMTVVGTTAGGLGSSSLAVTGTNVIQMEGNAGSGNTFTLPTLSGSGTFTLSTTTIADKWFALNGVNGYTGTLNLTGADGQTPMHVRIVANSSFNVLNLNDARISQRSGAGGSTSIIAIGELHTDDNVAFGAFEGGSPAVNAVWQIGSNNVDSNMGGVISDGGGSGGSTSQSGVTKVGTGVLTLSGASTYTGTTVVDDGSLEITGPSVLPDATTVFIEAGAEVNLTFAGSDTVDALFFGDQPQAAGTWGATGSGATNINDTFFSGTGSLMVTQLATVPTLIGDYNMNGVVDAADYVTVRQNYGAATIPNRDPRNFGNVGNQDYLTWRSRFGRTSNLGAGASLGNSSPVPEPATWMLVAMGLLGGCCGRRRN